MRLKAGQLKLIIKEQLLAESPQYYDSVELADGSRCPWGSPQHVKELETLLTGLETVKKQMRRTTASRATYATACKQLKDDIRRALRAQEKSGEDARSPVESGDENVSRTFSSLESGHNHDTKKSKKLEGTPRGVPADRSRGLGRTGLGRGAPAHGRYEPGFEPRT